MNVGDAIQDVYPEERRNIDGAARSCLQNDPRHEHCRIPRNNRGHEGSKPQIQTKTEAQIVSFSGAILNLTIILGRPPPEI
jgi:hypothetical protein